MASYRLLVDHGELVGQFEAPDRGSAIPLARKMSIHVDKAFTGGFVLEECRQGQWRSVLRWMPARIRYDVDTRSAFVPQSRTPSSRPATLTPSEQSAL